LTGSVGQADWTWTRPALLAVEKLSKAEQPTTMPTNIPIVPVPAASLKHVLAAVPAHETVLAVEFCPNVDGQHMLAYGTRLYLHLISSNVLGSLCRGKGGRVVDSEAKGSIGDGPATKLHCLGSRFICSSSLSGHWMRQWHNHRLGRRNATQSHTSVLWIHKSGCMVK